MPELLRNLNVEETKLKLVVRTEKKNFILAVNLCDKTVSFFFFSASNVFISLQRQKTKTRDLK